MKPPMIEVSRWVDELAETQGWAHHVADLDSGQLLTFLLDRPITPQSRSTRLSQLGQQFDASILGGPSYQLYPSVPRLLSPLAYLEVDTADIYSARQNRVYWTPPENETNFVHREIHFGLTVSPSQPCLITINLTGKGWPGLVGHVRLMSASPSFTQTIPIDAYVSHTVDFTFVPGNEMAGIHLSLETGIQLLTFDFDLRLDAATARDAIALSAGRVPLLVGLGYRIKANKWRRGWNSNPRCG